MGVSITVLMPVYNGGKYLEQSVESVLAQSYTDFEFIIINDGSTDSTSKILEKYAQKDERIKLVSRENKGLVATLNEGIQLARTSLIARMDADDIALPHRLEIQKKYMDAHPEVVCLGSGARVIDHKSRYLIDMETKTGYEQVELAALQGRTPITHPTAMMRTDAVKKAGGYKPDMFPAEDLALWLELSELGHIDNLADVLIEYRIHDNSISTQVHEKQILKIREICEIYGRKKGVKVECLAQPGRAEENRASKFEITLRHGWWAFSIKEWRTAAIYALKSIRLLPFKGGGWRLLFCSYFRRM